MEEQRAYRVEEQDQDSFGEVIIADEVISIIAGIAATEVDGVDSMDGGWSGALVSRMGIKDLARGVKVDLRLNICYGYAIPEVSKAVQERVVSSINSMTGLTVREVNVKISGVVNKENE